ncbi:MAG TPA: WG repeat-containing protein [Bacteroidales bacterium]|nr:WG repeat-containing protein [Bacteroidales bacterium]HRZ49025.1 WG repeat-containing protein [Bacteroidales bacterium]
MKTMLLKAFFLLLMLLYFNGSYAQNLPDLIPVRHGYKYGYADTAMQLKIPAVYDKAMLFYKGSACVQVGFKRGLIDSRGNALTTFIYDDIGSNGKIDSDFPLAEADNKYGYLDLKGNILIPVQFDDVNSVEDLPHLKIVKNAEKSGLYRFGKGELLPVVYDEIELLKNKLFLLKEGDKYGLADTNGRIITPVSLDQIYDFDYGNITWYRMGQKYGFINTKGVLITQAVYESCRSFTGGFAVVTRDRKNGFIDENGKEVVPPQYEYCSEFSDGVAVVGIDKKYALINAKGKVITPFEYKGAWPSTEGMIKVLKDNKWGYLNPKGKPVIPFQFDEAGQFFNGLAAAAVNGQWGYINKAGKWVVEPRYQKTLPFTEGKAMVVRDNLVYLMDKSLKEITVRGYDSVDVFSDGFARCWLGGRQGILRDDGREIVPPFYTSVKRNAYFPDRDFIVAAGKIKGMYYRDKGLILDTIYPYIDDPSRNGLIKVKLNEKYGYADTTGRLVIPCRYDDAYRFSRSVTVVKLDGKMGLINEKGEILIPLEYDGILTMEGIAVVKKGMKYGVVTHHNKPVAPFTFDDWSFEMESDMVRLRDAKGTVYFDAYGTRYEMPFEPSLEIKNPDYVPMNQTVLHRIHSKEVHGDYQIWVSLPFNYYQSNKSYPVVYLTDADQLQGTVAETSRGMAFDGTIPEVIVVGIAYGGTFDEWFYNRIPDLTPTVDTNALLYPGGGKCEAFYRFISLEVIPMVEKEYRVMQGERTLTGYSLGGLFGAWVLFNRPGTFNRYMLVSPSLWWDGQLALKWEEAWYQKSKELSTTLFMSLSSGEWGTPETLDKTLQTRHYTGLQYQFERIPGERHTSTFPAAAVKGLKFIYAAEKVNLQY